MALTSYFYTQMATKVPWHAMACHAKEIAIGANRAQNIQLRASIFSISRSVGTLCIDPVSTTKYDSYHMRVPGEHARPGCSVRNYLEQIVWQTLR